MNWQRQDLSHDLLGSRKLWNIGKKPGDSRLEVVRFRVMDSRLDVLFFEKLLKIIPALASYHIHVIDSLCPIPLRRGLDDTLQALVIKPGNFSPILIESVQV